jgi:hypothetical protein
VELLQPEEPLSLTSPLDASADQNHPLVFEQISQSFRYCTMFCFENLTYFSAQISKAMKHWGAIIRRAASVIRVFSY